VRVFGPLYAGTYDRLYVDKDYAGECDILEGLFKTYAPGGVGSVLDLGCGTGNHALLLADRGYDVVGVDRSAEMLQNARDKAGDRPGLEFLQGDVRDLDLGRRFDSCVLLFAVLGYQVENKDVLATLHAARRHLDDGGLLVFDCWYGPCVLADRPGERVRVVELPVGRLVRTVQSQLDVRRQLCRVSYRLWHIDGDRVLDEAEEEHAMRFFFPRELELLLRQTGFELLRLGAFPGIEHEPDETTWNVLAAARAVSADC
jgi:SAM-dependent methyltransferase